MKMPSAVLEFLRMNRLRDRQTDAGEGNRRIFATFRCERAEQT
jgi:hypothetical protein